MPAKLTVAPAATLCAALGVIDVITPRPKRLHWTDIGNSVPAGTVPPCSNLVTVMIDSVYSVSVQMTGLAPAVTVKTLAMETIGYPQR